MTKTLDRRVVRTRAAIKQAFVALLAERPFNSITINDIAERADVNRGTVYLHYLDKYDLLDKCMEEHLETVRGLCVPSHGVENGQASDEDMLLSAFRYFEEHHVFYYSMLENPGIPSFRIRLQEIMRRGIEAQIQMDGVNRHVNEEVLIQFAMLAASGVMEWWIMNKFPYPAEQMAEEVWTLLERHDIVRPKRGG